LKQRRPNRIPTSGQKTRKRQKGEGDEEFSASDSVSFLGKSRDVAAALGGGYGRGINTSSSPPTADHKQARARKHFRRGPFYL